MKWWWRDKNDFYVSGSLTIYFSEDHITTRDFREPDFFVVLGTDPRPRRSWMVWAERGKYPNLIIELLSNGIAAVDRGFKKMLYQDTFRTPEYFWFHPETLEFQGFWMTSSQYQPIQPNAQGWLWSQELSLFLGVDDRSLRFFSADGERVATPEERAQKTEQQAQQERQQRHQVGRQIAALKAKLHELGIDPDAVG